MAVITAPPIRRQLAGGAMRRYREAFGASLEDAAEILSCDLSKVRRIEAGERGIRPDELRLLLTEYGIDDGNDPSDAARDYLELEALSSLSVVISEAALHQAVGGPAVMQQQLAYLAALAGSAHVDLRVIPFDALSHPAPDLGALNILWFGGASARITAAYLPGAAAGQLLTGNDATPYLHAWERLSNCALALEESVVLLRRLAVT